MRGKTFDSEAAAAVRVRYGSGPSSRLGDGEPFPPCFDRRLTPLAPEAMRRRETETTQRTFADQARAMRAVPEDHALLRMRRAIDWAVLETALGAYYDTDVGRPSCPPTALLRMLILEQYADLSDREVHEQVGYNLLYRAFVGLGVDEPVPDDTTLVRFRARIGEAGLREVFDALNQQWAAAGLLGAERRVLDDPDAR